MRLRKPRRKARRRLRPRLSTTRCGTPYEGLAHAVDKSSVINVHTEDYTRATEKVAEGEALIEQSLDALKMKSNVHIAIIKAYIQSLKLILSEAQKLGGQKRRKKMRDGLDAIRFCTRVNLD